MNIEFGAHVRQGVCRKCGKRFTRRVIDSHDDGKMCRDCYTDEREANVQDVHRKVNE